MSNEKFALIGLWASACATMFTDKIPGTGVLVFWMLAAVASMVIVRKR